MDITGWKNLLVLILAGLGVLILLGLLVLHMVSKPKNNLTKEEILLEGEHFTLTGFWVRSQGEEISYIEGTIAGKNNSYPDIKWVKFELVPKMTGLSIIWNEKKGFYELVDNNHWHIPVKGFEY